MRTFLFSTVTVLDRKSTPTVGLSKITWYLFVASEVVEDEPADDGRLAY